MPDGEETLASSVQKNGRWAVTAAEDERALEGTYWLVRILEEPHHARTQR